MPRLFIALLIVLPFSGGDGAREGRQGNAFYENGRFEEAAEAYRAGLQELEEGDPSTTAARLWNNLGAALHRLERHEEAHEAFQQALAAAEATGDRARTAYNAGNNEAVRGNLEAALDFYRQALLAEPSHADARYNYEFVKRRLDQQDEQPQQGQEQEDIEPSDYARRLKAKAEALVEQQQYQDAYDLMTEGLKKDSTVQAFQSFITRVRDVSQIDSLGAAVQ